MVAMPKQDQELYDEAVANFQRPDPAVLGKEPWQMMVFGGDDPALLAAFHDL